MASRFEHGITAEGHFVPTHLEVPLHKEVNLDDHLPEAERFT
jgi:hypothetical protein